MPKTKTEIEEEVKKAFPESSAEEVNSMVATMLEEQSKLTEPGTHEYTIHVNIKHYVKIQASSKEEAFGKLKGHDFGQYIESPKEVRWHKEEKIS